MINNIASCILCTDPECMVLEDYTMRLDEANAAIHNIFEATSQAHLNLSAALLVEPTNTTTSVVIYNSLAHDRSELVHVHFVRPQGVTTIPSVFDSAGHPIPAQVKVNDEIISQLTVSAQPAALFEDSLYFKANVAALGYATYMLVFGDQNSSSTVLPNITMSPQPLSNSYMTVEFDGRTGLLSALRDISSGVTVRATQSYHQYIDGVGGAYCLVEQNAAVRIAGPVAVHTTKGPLFAEVVQTYAYGNGLQQRVRLCASCDAVEILHDIGMLQGGREIVSRLETDIRTAGTLYNDDSGFFEYRQRQRNDTGPIAQNYHAFVQTAALQEQPATNNTRELTVLSRRTMGVASLADGDLEYMLLRRLTDASDNQGPWPLDEREDIREKVWLLVGTVASSEVRRFARAMELENELIILYTAGRPKRPVVAYMQSQDPNLWLDLFVRHAMNTTVTTPSEYALRLQSFTKSPLPVSLSALGIPQMQDVVEKTLSLQQDRAVNDHGRMKWQAASSVFIAAATGADLLRTDDQVVLNQLDIRSYGFHAGPALARHPPVKEA